MEQRVIFEVTWLGTLRRVSLGGATSRQNSTMNRHIKQCGCILFLVMDYKDV